MSDSPYPWHRQAWQTLEHAINQERLPHALLLYGPPGSGVGRFMDLLLQRVLGTDRAGHVDAARQHLLAVGNHPDLTHLRPEKEGGVITVAQVRQLIDFLQLSSAVGGRRVACIRPAEAMNRNACNSLLKLLEEPPGPVLLLLAACRPFLLPATVLSRLVRVDLRARDTGSVAAWLGTDGAAGAGLARLWGVGPLQLAGLSDARGRELSTTVLEGLCTTRHLPVPVLAEQWQALGTERVLQWLLVWSRMLVRDQLCGCTTAPQALQQATSGLQLLSLVQLHDTVEHSLGRISAVGSSERNLLEEVLLTWYDLSQASPAEV